MKILRLYFKIYISLFKFNMLAWSETAFGMSGLLNEPVCPVSSAFFFASARIASVASCLAFRWNYFPWLYYYHFFESAWILTLNKSYTINDLLTILDFWRTELFDKIIHQSYMDNPHTFYFFFEKFQIWFFLCLCFWFRF